MSAQRPSLPPLPSEMIPPPRPDFSTFSFSSRIGHVPTLLNRMRGGSNSPSTPPIASSQPPRPMALMSHLPRAQTPVESEPEDRHPATPGAAETGSSQPQVSQPVAPSREGQPMEVDSITNPAPQDSFMPKSPPPLNRFALDDLWGDVSRVQAEWATVERIPVSLPISPLPSIPIFSTGIIPPSAASTREDSAAVPSIRTEEHAISHPSHSVHAPRSMHEERILVKQEEPVVFIKVEEGNASIIKQESDTERPSVSLQREHTEPLVAPLPSRPNDVQTVYPSPSAFEPQQTSNQTQTRTFIGALSQRQHSPSSMVNITNARVVPPTPILVNGPLTGPVEPPPTRSARPSHLPDQIMVANEQRSNRSASSPTSGPPEIATRMNGIHAVLQPSKPPQENRIQPIGPNSINPLLSSSHPLPPILSAPTPSNDQTTVQPMQTLSAQQNRTHRETTDALPKNATPSRSTVPTGEPPAARTREASHTHIRNASWGETRAVYERPSRRSPPLPPIRQDQPPVLRFASQDYHNGPPALQYSAYSRRSPPRRSSPVRRPSPPGRYRPRSPRHSRSRSPPPRRGYHVPYNLPEPGTPPHPPRAISPLRDRSPPRRPYSPRRASPPLRGRRQSPSPIASAVNTTAPAYLRRAPPELARSSTITEMHKSRSPQGLGRNATLHPPTAPRAHNGSQTPANFSREVPPHQAVRSTRELQNKAVHDRSIPPKKTIHGNLTGLSRGPSPQDSDFLTGVGFYDIPGKLPQAIKRTAMDRDASDADTGGENEPSTDQIQRKRRRLESGRPSQPTTTQATTPSLPQPSLPADEPDSSERRTLLMRLAGNSSPKSTSREHVEQPPSPRAAPAGHGMQRDALLQRFNVFEGPSSSLVVSDSRSEPSRSRSRDASEPPSMHGGSVNPNGLHNVPLTERIAQPPPFLSAAYQPSASHALPSRAQAPHKKKNRLQNPANQHEASPNTATAQVNTPPASLAARLNAGEPSIPGSIHISPSSNRSLLDRLHQ